MMTAAELLADIDAGEEMSVDQLVEETHSRCCVPRSFTPTKPLPHDPACRTLRMLVNDQRQLAQERGNYRLAVQTLQKAVQTLREVMQ